MGTVLATGTGSELRRVAEPWQGERGLSAVLDAWRRDSGFARCLTLDRRVPGRGADTVPVPGALSDEVRRALGARGIVELYRHQAEAFERARAGEHLVIATPTASGKSLCYQLPVLDALARNSEARALYMFPTKALARDQESAVRALMSDAGISAGAVTYDGDTPPDARRAARERSRVLLTNPDMLHAGILPHHTNWARLFANLEYVVIDELHSYRGVFGSHLANVIRRLRRLAAFHGASPTFIFASATIGNPREHASRMLGSEVGLIDESGAPTGPRRVLLYNPPVVNAELGIRRSYLKCAVRVAADLVRAEVPTLVFGQSRNGVEVMLKYLRDRLSGSGIDSTTIRGYRGGYLPDARRRIEAGLRDGTVRCVVATNALELGIDIGSLDAVVCAGYPGSVASLWQRFGRGGRREGESLAILVTSSAPLDQYLAADSDYVVGAPVEHARIDPDNVEILVQHLKCAAFELPFLDGDRFGDVSPDVVRDVLGYLTEHRVLHQGVGPAGQVSYHWVTDSYPANDVSLRSASWDNVVIVDLGSDRVLAEMDWRSTHTMLHEQAIYQHAGEQYQVERLDYDNHKAFVRRVLPDYYTTAMTHTKVSVLEQAASADLALAGPATLVGEGATLRAGLGEVSVVEKVVGYKKIKFHTHENVGYGDVHLPEMQMHTSAFWLVFPESLVTAQPVPRAAVIDALRGLSKAMHTVAAIGLMIDPRDLGRTLGSRHGEEGTPRKSPGGGPGFDPTIFLYDQVAGGIGLSPRLFEDRAELLRRSRVLIDACPCDDGCPACIGPDSGLGGGPERTMHDGRKRLALSLLDQVGAEPVY